MSDGADPGSVAIGAAVVTGVGFVGAFVKSLFTRNITAGEKTLEKMQADISSILLEVRSHHDEQTRQRADIAALGKDVATVVTQCRAAHDRIDALVAPSPRTKR